MSSRRVKNEGRTSPAQGMVDLRIEGGAVVTMNADREIIDDGAVAIDDGVIIDVGSTSGVRDRTTADRVIDASGRAVLPGFINAHTHVNDILIRGGVGADRALHDWLLNVNKPTLEVMSADDHGVAAGLFCLEAVQSGITTFVDNAAGTGVGMSFPDADRRARIGTYASSGLRVVWAQEFVDRPVSGDERMEFFTESQARKLPTTTSDVEPFETDEAIAHVRSVIDDHHGSANGRITVWPAPIYPWAVSPKALQESVAIAEEADVMTSTHISEITQQERHLLSSVEYLESVGYLGERTLLGHCVHVDEPDIRRLAESGTKVAHNVLTNHALGSGVAPVPTMHGYGVTIGLGTDNPSASDTVNMVNDLRFAAHTHKGNRRDAAAMTAETVLEMATIEGAHAIGRADDLGSIAAGKRGDVIIIDLDQPHLTPRGHIPSMLVYGAQGFEVETAIVDGRVVMDDRQVPGITTAHPDLLAEATDRSRRILEEAGLPQADDRPWTSRIASDR